jgi:hypothetical protein
MVLLSTQLNRVGPFFLLSVWSPCYTLSRRKKDFQSWDSVAWPWPWDHNIYMGTQNGSNHEL